MADIQTVELKKINEYVGSLDSIVSLTGAILYGLDSDGNSVKIELSRVRDTSELQAKITAVETKAETNRTNIATLSTTVDGKADAVHTHLVADVVGLSDALDDKSDVGHTHAISDVTNLSISLEGKSNEGHTHEISDVSDLTTALGGKSNVGHSHYIEDVQGLQTALDGKANAVHTHTIPEIEQLQNTVTEQNARITAAEQEVIQLTVAAGIPQLRDFADYTPIDGSVVQYIGETTATYTTNYLYRYTESTDSWARVNVQPEQDISGIATNAAAIQSINDKIGSANGIASLDSSGKVPSTELPSYVDDVLEFSSLSNFPETGVSGIIYIALDTNITYRWGSSTYVPIGSNLALGETSSTAYRGDRGKTAYDHSQTTGNPHGTTLSDLPSVQTALNAKQDTITKNQYLKQVVDIDDYVAELGEIVKKVGGTTSEFVNNYEYKAVREYSAGLEYVKAPTSYNFKVVNTQEVGTVITPKFLRVDITDTSDTVVIRCFGANYTYGNRTVTASIYVKKINFNVNGEGWGSLYSGYETRIDYFTLNNDTLTDSQGVTYSVNVDYEETLKKFSVTPALDWNEEFAYTSNVYTRNDYYDEFWLCGLFLVNSPNAYTTDVFLPIHDGVHKISTHKIYEWERIDAQPSFELTDNGSATDPIYVDNGTIEQGGKFHTINTVGEIKPSTGDDLNDYTTPGTYGTDGGYGGSTLAQSLLNCPVTCGFRMTVQTAGYDDQYICQILIGKNSTLWLRHGWKSSGSTTYDNWSTWGQFADSSSFLATAGGTVTGTLILSRTQDASGTANNKPALIIGGTDTQAHIEIDGNEILAKASGTTSTKLYLQDGNGELGLAGSDYSVSNPDKFRTAIGAGTSSLAIGTTASTAASGNHTHALTLATDTGTSSITLALGSKYKLTAGGKTLIFTMPAKPSYTASDVGAMSSTVNTSSSVTWYNNRSGSVAITKIGRVVVGYIGLNSFTTSLSVGSTICSLPYTPSQSIYFPVQNSNSDNALMRIDANSAYIKAGTANLGSNISWYGMFVYIATS